MDSSNMKKHREIAENYFREGYNCTQAVVLAFSDMFEVDKDNLMKIASSFGGGMGRMREVCGAVSGMCIVMGLYSGYSDAQTGEIKANHYKNIQTVLKRFESENGTLICRNLLGVDIKHDSNIPQKRTEEYYKKRPCVSLVGTAAQILDDFFENNK